MVARYTKIFHCETLQNLPKLGFWFENKPSGNPDQKIPEPKLGILKYFLPKKWQKLAFCVRNNACPAKIGF
jgi:hypothetical protein